MVLYEKRANLREFENMDLVLPSDAIFADLCEDRDQGLDYASIPWGSPLTDEVVDGHKQHPVVAIPLHLNN